VSALRIGILVRALGGGGAERTTRAWAEGLARRGHDVTVLTYEDPDPGAAVPGVTRLQRPAKGARERWTALPAWVGDVTRERRPDVVVGVMDFANLVVLAGVAAGSRGGPRPAVVLTEHNVLSVLTRAEGAAGAGKRALARALYRRADAVVGCSHAVATDLAVRYGVPADRLHVLLEPIARATPPRARPPEAGRPLRIAFAGRLVAQKRPERVLAVLRELGARGVPASAVFIGDGDQRARLEREATAGGLDAAFPGWVDDWQPLAAGCDCLLLPSDVEGLGMVLVEAAGMGLPSVAPSPALGVADAVVPGLTGILSLSTAPRDLADAVLEAVALPRDPALAAGWLRRFDPDHGAALLERVLTAAVARAPRAHGAARDTGAARRG